MRQADHTTLRATETNNAADNSALRVWGERSLLAFMLLLFLARAFIPAWKHLDSDFTNNYLAARLYREGYPIERVYDWTWFQRQKDHAGIVQPLVAFVPSTLPSILLILPFSFLPPVLANRCWLLVSSGLLLATVVALKRITSSSWTRVGLLGFLAVAPLHDNFVLGEIQAVLLLLLTLAFCLYFRDRHFLCGISLAAATAIRVYPALLLPYFLLRKQWRAAAGFVCGTAGLILISTRLFGIAASHIYFRQVLPSELRGEILDPYAIEWNSVNAFLRRLFVFEPELNPVPVAHLPHLYALLHAVFFGLILASFLWVMTSKENQLSRKRLEWATMCCIALLLAPAPLSSDLLVLILVAVIATECLIAQGQSRWAAVIAFLYAFTCLPYNRFWNSFPRGWSALLSFPRMYSMLLLSGALLWVLIAGSNESLDTRRRSRSFAVVAISSAVVSAVVFTLDSRHLTGQFDNYATRVTTSIGSAIAVNPVTTEDSVFFEALVPRFSSIHDAFFVHEIRAGVTTRFGGGGDWFHPATTLDGKNVWAEIASATGSRVVRVGSAQRPATGRIATQIDDAEEPVASPDAEWLVYSREIRGRASLWARHLRQEGAGPNVDRELAGVQYDVSDPVFSPDNKVVFSSQRDGEYHLFSVDPKVGLVVELAGVGCSARYPAFSVDGNWIAFSCELGGNWQLVAQNRVTGERQYLTDADCNSITPTWAQDSRSLIYATDCGRAPGVTALSRLIAAH